MYTLPSEQKEAVQNAKAEFEQTGKLRICEPCDCGSHTRHNNGGNYHQIVDLRVDDSRVFVRYDTTCELTPCAEWREIDFATALGIIDESGDWL